MRMRTGISRPMIFVVISVLVVALVYSSPYTFIVFALPPDDQFGWTTDCSSTGGDDPISANTNLVTTCCWNELVPEGTGNPDLGGYQEQYCQTCTFNPDIDDYECEQKELQYFEGRTPGLGVLPEGGILDEPPAPPSGPAAPLQDGGVLEQPPTPPPTAPAAPLQDGVLEQEQPPTPPSSGPVPPGLTSPSGPAAPLQDGVLEQPPATPTPPQDDAELPPCSPGEVTTTDCIPQDSSCPPGTIGTPPECLPPCSPGEVTTTDCIPPPAEEPPAEEPPAEEPPAEEPPAEEEPQPTEEEDGLEDNSNN